MFTDKRKTIEKFYQIKSLEELKQAIKDKKDIYFQDGEDFGESISWFKPKQEYFFISEEGYEDVHNSGPDVLCILSREFHGKVSSSYSYVDKKGYFRRRKGHEHLTRVLYKVAELEPFIVQVKDSKLYNVAGNMFTEEYIMKALKISSK